MESHLELLNIWIGQNYDREKERLSLRYGMYFSEDFMVDAYLMASKKICFFGMEGKTIARIFEDCYKEISLKNLKQKMMYINPEQLFFDLLKADEEGEDGQGTGINSKEILYYVKKRHNVIYEVFKLHFINGINIRQLARMRNLSHRDLQKKLEKVKREIKNKFRYDYF